MSLRRRLVLLAAGTVGVIVLAAALLTYAAMRAGLRDQIDDTLRSQVFELVWGYDFGPTSNALGVYIGYLRRKTEAGGEPRLLHTVRGVGYVLKEA